MFARLRPMLTVAWQGPPQLACPLRLEWQFIIARWTGSLFMFAVLPLLNLSVSWLAIAEALVVVAVAYNSVVHWAVLRRPGLVESGCLTTTLDSVLNVAMVLTLGAGFDSPFSSFLVAVNVAVAMRYGYALALGAGLTYYPSRQPWLSPASAQPA